MNIITDKKLRCIKKLRYCASYEKDIFDVKKVVLYTCSVI